MTRDRKPEPKPPDSKIKFAGHHWIQHWDFDGRATDLVVLQWCPGVQRWAQSGHIATGNYIRVEGSTYISECPLPAMD